MLLLCVFILFVGGGIVDVGVKMIRELKHSKFLNDSLVKRIRGTCYASKASINVIGRMINSAREVLNDYIPDVWIYSEYSKGNNSAKDPGFGVCLTAETRSGILISTDKCFDHFTTNKEFNTPENIGKYSAMQLIDEILYSGVVDSTF
jgi:RNA 3'-terminal phosphate cyclase-like protein